MMDWFKEKGAFVLVDGQFGSTGKGLFAAYIATNSNGRITKFTTNAGPNSGHTAYYPLRNGLRGDDIINPDPVTRMEGLDGYEKIVTKQLPVASVFYDKMGWPRDTIINAGAIIDYSVMLAELGKWCNSPGSRVLIHPNAALITNEDRERDKESVHAIAGTGQGVGPSLMMKIARTRGKDAIASHIFAPFLPPEYNSWDDLWDWNRDVVFVETAQGYSLGINSSRFYPCTTSRECTVMQALADARIPAQMVRKVAATYRTYPIRVGNTDNSSGDWYPDQTELSWGDIGVEPELTTVTKRVRRVATWSWIQYRESLAANRPDVIFLNFANYMKVPFAHVNQMINVYREVLGKSPDHVYLGYGPLVEDVQGYYHNE